MAWKLVVKLAVLSQANILVILVDINFFEAK